MSSMREKWNRRYLDKSAALSSPPTALEMGWSLLKAGSVLDLACGDGGSALFLARQGFDVTAVDIAEEGLKRLEAAAVAEQLTICTFQCDLDDATDLFAESGRFDNIVINRFRPAKALFVRLPALLKPQGKLMLNSFNLQQHRQKGFSERFCLTDQEYLYLTPELSVEYYRSKERDGDYMDEYLFIKAGG